VFQMVFAERSVEENDERTLKAGLSSTALPSIGTERMKCLRLQSGACLPSLRRLDRKNPSVAAGSARKRPLGGPDG
jgi:hypothetical protein